MFPPTQEKFIDKAMKLLQNQLVDMGIVIRRPELLKNIILQICTEYYELKKSEDI